MPLTTDCHSGAGHAIVRRNSAACWLALFVFGILFALRISAPAQGPDHFTVGHITVDKKTRTVRFPAVVNLSEGALEYLLVTDKGKTHESLFSTTISPFQLNIAMLLIGGSPTREIAELPPAQISAGTLKSAPEIKGDPVEILVAWTPRDTGEPQQIDATEWIGCRLLKTPVATGPWIYTGSAIYKKRFLAQEDGSIIALVTDPAALINNPRPGHDDDTVWSVLKGNAPAVGTPVEIILRLSAPASKTSEPPAK